MGRSRSATALLGVAAGVFVLLLWFGGLGRPALWTDEEFTLRYAASYATIDDDVHPPPYYAIVRTLFSVAPDTLVSVRALSATAFLGAVALWAVLGRRWFREGHIPATAAGTAVVLSLLSPQALLFGRMARYFGLTALATAAALLTWWSVLERGGRARTAGAVVAHVALGLLSYPAFLVTVAAETLTVLVRRRADLRRHLPLAVVAGVLWLAAVALLPTDDSKFGGSEAVNRPAMAAIAATLPLWSATVGETVSPVDPLIVPSVAAWVVVGVAVLAALRAASLRRRRPGDPPDPPEPPAWLDRATGWLPADPVVLVCTLLVLGTLAALVAVTITVDLAHTGLQAPKYFAPIAPAFYLLVGLGFDRIRRWGRRPVAAIAIAAAVAVGWGTGIANLFRSDDFLYPSYALPWTDVADAVDRVAREAVAAGEGNVAVLSGDRAFLRLLADRRPPADLLDISPDESDRAVYDGAPPGRFVTVIIIERPRLNPSAELAVDAARGAAEAGGLVVVSTQTFGEVDPGLRRIQELFSGRELETYLVGYTILRLPEGT